MFYALFRTVSFTDYLRTNISGINGEELNPHAGKVRVEFSEELQRKTERERELVRKKTSRKN